MFFSPSIRISEKSIKFGDEKINKRSFYKTKKPFKVEDTDINKILVSNKESFEKKKIKCFIGYNDDDDVIRPLFV